MESLTSLISPALTLVMKALSWLGSESFFVLCLPLGYWLWQRPAFARLSTLLLISIVLNTAFKEWWQAPRPSGQHLVDVRGWSFPSGHAQNAAAMWGWLAFELRRRWATLAAIALTCAIMTSRLYLGVHHPVDVIGGALIGLCLIGLGVLLKRSKVGYWLVANRLSVMAVFATTAIVALLVLVGLADPEGSGLRAAGALMGFASGALWLHRSDPPNVASEWPRRTAAVALGLSITLLLWKGLKLLAPGLAEDVALVTLTRYALVGGWVAAGSWRSFEFFHFCIAQVPATQAANPKN